MKPGDSPPPAGTAERPDFAEPWQAQLLAIVDQLTRNGVLEAGAWSLALGGALRRHAAAGVPDTADAYYRAVLETLETLLEAGGATTADSLDRRQDAWRNAYLATPHGQPVRPPET